MRQLESTLENSPLQGCADLIRLCLKRCNMFGSGPNRVMVGEKRAGRINHRLCSANRETGEFSVIVMKGLGNLRILDR